MSKVWRFYGVPAPVHYLFHMHAVGSRLRGKAGSQTVAGKIGRVRLAQDRPLKSFNLDLPLPGVPQARRSRCQGMRRLQQ